MKSCSSFDCLSSSDIKIIVCNFSGFQVVACIVFFITMNEERSIHNDERRAIYSTWSNRDLVGR